MYNSFRKILQREVFTLSKNNNESNNLFSKKTTPDNRDKVNQNNDSLINESLDNINHLLLQLEKEANKKGKK